MQLKLNPGIPASNFNIARARLGLPLQGGLNNQIDQGIVTGVPVLLNTSFNRRGEPIVESPQDAVDCFIDTDIDALVIGNVLVEKQTEASSTHAVEAQPKSVFEKSSVTSGRRFHALKNRL